MGNTLVTIVPVILFFYLVFVLQLPFDIITNNIVHIVGVALLISGGVLSQIAFKHIGYVNSDDFWRGRKVVKERTLTTNGPYKYIRHPLAFSMIVLYAGLVIIFFHPIPLVIYLAGTIFIVYTSFSEEKFMQKQFPKYSEYKKRTGMFLPKM